MRRLARCALSISAATAVLAACGRSQPPIGALGAAPQTVARAPRVDSAKYKVVYSFGEPPDGQVPMAGLIAVRGKLYGTTVYGGTNAREGTVFSITKSGTESVLHSFGSVRGDGVKPVAPLIDVHGTLYGTTRDGGAYGHAPGTVFSITPQGTETVLHSFGHGNDGTKPAAALADVGGTLYGTTQYGGTHGAGTVFSITTSGTESVLYSFGDVPDAGVPVASLVDVGGTLYGTTAGGGSYAGCAIYRGAGTVFSITPSGSEKVLHSFGQAKDGCSPLAGLIDVGGTLYGTTEYGGAHGGGTVFSITMDGTETVLHSFGSGADGQYPAASLIDVGGTLYGTTRGGGAYGGGTVFSITTSGTETVLHSFGYGSDGHDPCASLIDVNGTLYGTTPYRSAHGKGIVFSLTP